MELSYRYSKGTPATRMVPRKQRRSASPRSFRAPPSGIRSLFMGLLKLGVTASVLGILLVVGLIGWYSRELPDPNKLLDRAIPLSTKIFDRTGTHLLYEIHGDQQRTLVSLQEIPDSLKWATITTEDKDFYNHKGFDVRGILRSIFIDVLRGGKAQGGSTITQQFIKNSLLSSKKTFTRKLKELVLAYQLEKKFSKDQILQMYFNEIPYGSISYGAQSASMLYFGKEVKKLTLAESALLASLPKAPTYYSPWGKNRDKLFARQQYILQSMVGAGYISPEEADDAKKEHITFRDPGQAFLAPHFVLYIRDQLNDTYGDKLVQQGGLKVITTLDYDKQVIAEATVTRLAEKNLTLNAHNAALVSLDARTGDILAMVGSKDYFNKEIDGNVNVALRKRQPGSSFKPIVYATAFSRGYTPDTTVFDLVTNFDTTGDGAKAYTPHNYTGKEYGPVTMRSALAGSLNIASVKILYLAGVRNVIEQAKKMGYESLGKPDQYGLALVLGGAEVSLLEHVAAYSTFARDGVVVSPVSVLRVEDKNGTVLQETKPQEPTRVLDTEVARQVTSILTDQKAREYIFMAHNYLSLPGRAAGVKTGTTNDYRDAWTIGYTPSIVTGVWVGNNDNSAMSKGADGSKVAAPIWKEYMTKILSGTAVEQFQAPQEVHTGKDILDGKIGKETIIKIDKTTGLLTTDQTPPDQVEEKIYQSIHSILYFVDKDNPQGPEPEHPEKDPQFAVWEKNVREWVAKNHLLEEEAPQRVDLLHTPQNTPTLTIITPQENETVTESPLTATVQTQSPRGVLRVEYYLDDKLLATTIEKPFSLSSPLTGTENGFHTLLVKSFDDVGNTQSASLTINILLKKK